VPERISWAVEQLDVQPTDRLLEIGSGRGVAVELICRQLDGGHVLAIDRSAKATDAAAQRNARYAAAGSASFEEISLEDADLGEARFDKVFTINVNRLFTVEGVVAGWMVVGALVPHPAGDDPPVPVHRVWPCVVPGHQPRGRTAGRELMVKLIESLSAGVPRPLVEIAKLGRTLSKRAADDWPTSTGRHQQRSNRSDQRRPGAPARRRLRLRQPRQLHRPIPTRDRRIQTPTTPCIGEEPLLLGVGLRYDGNRQPVILS
jgi:hypothetical protein